MSYDIIYNKQFVKLRRTGEVIPMLLAGSNNCYEIAVGGGNGRRSRSWESFRYYNRKGKLSEKPEVILRKVDAEIGRYIRTRRDRDTKPADIRNHFGYYASLVVGSGHCGGTSWNQWRGVFANGIKNALTIEDLNKLGVNLQFNASFGSSNGYPASVLIKTEREYFTEIKKWRGWHANGGRGFYLDFSPYNTDRVLERLRAGRRKPPREKTDVRQDHFFVLSNGQGALVRYTRRGYRYTFSTAHGRRYRTEQDAEKYRQQIVDKGRHQADIWKVERIEGTATFQV